MTYWQFWIWRAALSFVLVLVMTALASAQAGGVVAQRESASTPRFDAGASVLVNLNDPSWFSGIPWGGWFTVGSGRVRVSADYWSHREGGEYSHTSRVNGRVFGNQYTMSMGLRYLQGALSVHFRSDRRLTPHLLVGGGYHGITIEDCVLSNAPLRRTSCDGGVARTPILMAGVGMDLALGSRFFARTQFRGFYPVGGNAEFFRRVQTSRGQFLVGGGVRF